MNVMLQYKVLSGPVYSHAKLAAWRDPISVTATSNWYKNHNIPRMLQTFSTAKVASMQAPPVWAKSVCFL